MGLDITAYEALKQVDEHTYDPDTCHCAGHVLVYNDYEFQDRANGLLYGQCYTPQKRVFSFNAGAYHHYNWWRNELAQMAHGFTDEAVWNGSLTEGAAFSELIDFTDCEGTIGPVLAEKLAKDFEDNYAKAKSLVSDEHMRWIEKYEAFMRAFQIAAKYGAVMFH